MPARMPAPQAKTAVRIIARQDVPAIHSVEVDGRTYHLGLLKNFRKNAYLDAFIPQSGRPSIGWVALKRDEVLEVHRHPIASVIVITRGEGALLTNPPSPIAEGDVVCVPPGAPHGFVGRGNEGFWALSLQFEDRGLYEDTHNPLVEFGQAPAKDVYVTRLHEENERLFARFKHHPIFEALDRGDFADRGRQAKLIAALQVWSDHFHKMLLLRSATCDHPQALDVFNAHLREEFPHSKALSQERSQVEPPWDAQLSAACSWFVSQMSILDNLEKVVLVHMVTERAATGFYAAASHHLMAEAKDHITAHAEDDCEHARMGLELLAGINHTTFVRLCRVQARGWAMMETLLQRICALGLKEEL